MTDAESTIHPHHQPPSDPAFAALVTQSMGVLRALLADSTLAPMERANIALKILALAQGRSPENSGFHADLAGADLLDLMAESGGITNAPNNHPSPNLNAVDLNINGGMDNSLVGSPIAVSPEVSFSSAPSWPLHGEIIQPRWVQLENFLSPEENREALAIALDHRANFLESSTTTNANDYRQSSVLYATYYADLYHLLRKRILKMMPRIVKELDIPPFLVSQVEMQMTAHGDGCFYKIHNDSGSPETATRVLTYVYYFHQNPKAYSGGALRIYETDVGGPATEPSEKFADVIPANNSIVLFDSRVKHEVLPVVCPSRKFEDSRFTLNGWLRQV